MRHYDPWIFGMLWEIEHREELGRLAKAQQVRQAAAWQAAQSSGSGAQRRWSDLGQLISCLISGSWLRLRRPAAKVS
jgi:hypothetical protein